MSGSSPRKPLFWCPLRPKCAPKPGFQVRFRPIAQSRGCPVTLKAGIPEQVEMTVADSIEHSVGWRVGWIGLAPYTPGLLWVMARSTQTRIKGKSAWSIGAPAGTSWSSPGKGGEVTQGRGAWVMSSPKKRTEYTRLRCEPSTPAEACRLSM